MTFEEEAIKKIRQGSEGLKGPGEVLQKMVEEAVRKVLAGTPYTPPSVPFPFPDEGKGPSAGEAGIRMEAVFPTDPKKKAVLKKELSALAASIKGRIGPGGKKVILVTSVEGGAGIGPLCAWLAASWSLLFSGNVLLLDGDLENPSLHRWFGIDPTPGLTEVLSGRNRREEAWRKSDRINFYFLPAGEPVSEPCLWPGWEGWPDLLSLLRTDFDVLFINAPPLSFGPETEWMLPWVDASILILKAHETLRETARQAVKKLERSGGLLGIVWKQ
jgi:Mrp family chromosome partitioning ATPase